MSKFYEIKIEDPRFPKMKDRAIVKTACPNERARIMGALCKAGIKAKAWLRFD